MNAAFVGADLSEVTERVRQSTVKVRDGRQSLGSGVVWDSGVIVTNAHVATVRKLQIETPDGRVLSADVEKRNASRDLASLRVDHLDLPAAARVPAAQLRVGELVIAVGHPLGLTGAAATGGGAPHL